MKTKLNFRRTFIGFCLFITCVPAVIFSGYLLSEIKLQSQRTFDRDVAHSANALVNFLEDSLADTDTLSQILSQDADIIHYIKTNQDFDRVHQKLNLILTRTPNIDYVFLYNQDLSLLDTAPLSTETLANIRLSEGYYDLIKRAKQHGRSQFLMEVIESEKLHTMISEHKGMPKHHSNYIASFAIPLIDNNQTIGILTVFSSMDHLYKTFDTFFTDDIFSLDVLYNEQSLTLAATPTSDTDTLHYIDYPFHRIADTGDDRITLAVSYPSGAGSKFVDEVIFKLIIIIAVTISVICLFAFKASQWFIEPIMKLNELMQDYIQENYRRAREYIRFYELDEIAEGANTLANKVADKIEGNEELIRNQEETIKSRTEMLRRSLTQGKEREVLLNIINDLAFDMQTYEEIEQLVEASLTTIQRVFKQWKTGILLMENKDSPAQQFLESFSTVDRSVLQQMPADIQMDAIERYMHNAMINIKQPIKQNIFWMGLPILDKNNAKLGILVMKGPRFPKAHQQMLHVFIKQLGGFLENKQLYKELEVLASTDPLTGLYNRLYFDNHFKKAVYNLSRHPESHFSVFVIDVNRLKYINDEFGHEFGDSMLKKVAEVLRIGRRETDIVARIGGDEFYILLPDTTHEICEHLTSRFNEMQADLYLTLRSPSGTVEKFKIHYSIGFAATDKVSPEKLIKIADERMYDAKQAYYHENKLTQRKV